MSYQIFWDQVTCSFEMYVLMYVDYKFFLICSIVLCFAFVGGNSMKRCGVTLNWYVMFEMKLLIWYVMVTGCKDLRVSISQVRCWG